MLLKIVFICKECYIKNHGELPTQAYGPLYQLTEEECHCEICNKKDYLILTTEPVDEKDIIFPFV